MEPAAPEVLIRREGRAGRITLNRPKALNALTLGMVREIWPALLAWKDDPEVEARAARRRGRRGLCAGGDVRWLYDSRSNGSADARAFWSEEYRLNALISRYPKPYVPFMDGIVMGGGIGLSAHGAPPHRHRAQPAGDARDQHRAHSRCRRHLAAVARAGRGRRLPRPHGRAHARCGHDLCRLRRTSSCRPRACRR